MSASISSFFAPRNIKSQKAAIEIPKKKTTFQSDDGWQRAIGLTTNDAIEIVDSDVEETTVAAEINSAKESYSEEKAVAEAEGEILVAAAASVDAIETAPAKNVSPCTESVEIDPINMTKMNPEDETTDDDCDQRPSIISSVIDLCSPASTQASMTKSSPPSSAITSESNGTIDSAERSDNRQESISTNPFLKFAHDLGGPESSYFADLLKSSNDVEEKSKSETKGSKSTKRKESKERAQCASKQPCKSRKRTMVKDAKDCEFSKKTKEELEECRNKWQSFADLDAPVEIRRFQVLIAARIHCQAHEGTVRKAMITLRNHYREPSLESSPLQSDENGSNTEQVNVAVEQRYLSPETLSKADPEEIAKMISSVLFANVKSKQIVQAAKEVKHQFYCKVPESETSLKSITGIGPKLAELLFHVNSHSSHEKGFQALAIVEKKEEA
jgi:endonuclease III